MALIRRVEFERDGVRYELELDFNLEDSSRDVWVQDLVARISREDEEPYEVRVRVELSFEKDWVALVNLPTGRRVRIPLGEVPINWGDEEEGTYPKDVPERDAAAIDDPALEMVRANFPREALEIVGDSPLGEPLACLVKAGVTSIIGQVLICREVSDRSVRGIYGCMREHARSIGRYTIIRTIRCMLF